MNKYVRWWLRTWSISLALFVIVLPVLRPNWYQFIRTVEQACGVVFMVSGSVLLMASTFMIRKATFTDAHTGHAHKSAKDLVESSIRHWQQVKKGGHHGG